MPPLNLSVRPRKEGPLTFAPAVTVEDDDPFEAIERAAGAVKPGRIEEALDVEEREYLETARDRGKDSGITADEETAKIKASAQTAKAKGVHKFVPAEWTHPNGHPRCAVCGQEESISPECNRQPTKAEMDAFDKWLDDQFPGRTVEEAAAMEGIRTGPALLLEADMYRRVLNLLVQEGAYWDPEKHPRWPKGTPLAGQFMEVGQRFELNGVEYDVASAMPGKIHANVATKGSAAGAKTVSFTDAQLAKATRPVAEPIQAATKAATKSSAAGGHAGTATVINPIVDKASHDSSIPIPEAAKGYISPEAWKRFGQVDQERYSQLMERFGAWSPGKSGTLVQKALSAAQDAQIKKLVVDGYSSQKGSSTGLTIGLHQLFSKVVGAVKGGSGVEKARSDFEKARALQNELASAMQWDLYNRTRSPDVSLFHKHSAHGTFGKVVAGQLPVFSGLSMSQHYRKGWWSDGCFATPMAIRHVVMSTISGNVTSGFENEQEVATADPFAVPAGKAMDWSDSNFALGKAKWLESQTHQAASGETLEMLQKATTDPSFELPIPPSPPVVQLDKQGGKSWKEPPPAAQELWKSWGTKPSPGGDKAPNLAWVKADKNGNPVPKEANQLRLKAGDYIQGNPKSQDKGTIYVVVEDHSDSYMGLAYYKLTESDGVTPAPPGTAYNFEGGGTTKFKKIDAHFDMAAAEKTATEAAGQQSFNPQAWSEGVDKKFVHALPEGAKFNVHGVAYEVMPGVTPGAGSVKIKQLDTGELGAINGDYKTPTLQLKPGFTEGGGEEFDQTQFFQEAEPSVLAGRVEDGDVVFASGSHWKLSGVTGGGTHATMTQLDGAKAGKTSTDVPLSSISGVKLMPKPLGWSDPQPGDTLAIDGKKAKVTKVLRTGEVQINLSPGVMKVNPNDPILAGIFSQANHEIGSKVKLKHLEPGQKFHGGSGSAIRPYMVVSHDAQSKQTTVRNLDTGELSKLSRERSFKQLMPKAAPSVAAPELGHVTPGPEHVGSASFDPQAFENGGDVLLSDLDIGSKFTMKGVPYEVTSLEGVGEAKNLEDGTTTKIGAPEKWGSITVPALVPKGTTTGSFASSTAGDLEAGDHFIHGGAPYKTTHVHSEYVDAESVTSAAPLSLHKSTEVTKIPSPSQPEPEPSAPSLSTFSEMPVGSHFQSPGPDGEAEPSGPVFKKTSDIEAVNLVTGDVHPFSGAVGGFEYHRVPAPAGGNTDQEWADFMAGSTPTAALAPDPQTAQLPATAYDPSAYVSGGTKTLADLKAGDIFVGGKNGKHYLVTKTGAKSGLSALNLMTGKVSSPWGYEKKAEVLHAKSDGAVASHDDLKPGDPVQIGKLEVGDHIQLQPGGSSQVVEIVSKGQGGEAPQVAVAPVNADYSLGQPGTAGTHPLAVVTFHASAAQAAAKKDLMTKQVAAGAVPEPASEADPSHYPDAETDGLVPFSAKSKTGGGYFFTKAKLAGEGTLLQDKSGMVWKVKQAGASPIVTDGSDHFQVNGEHNLKVVNDHPFTDTSPPLHGASVQDTAAEVAHSAESTPPSSKAANYTLGEAGLGQGDTFTTTMNAGKYSGTWEVTASGIADGVPQGYVSGVNMKTGATQTFGPAFQLTSIGKGVQAPKTGKGFDTAPLEEGPTVDPSELKAGDVFKSSLGTAYKVAGDGGDGPELFVHNQAGQPAVWSKMSGPVTKMQPAGSGGGIPDPADLPGGKITLDAAPEGTLVSMPGITGDDSQPAVFKVVSKGVNSATLQVVKRATGPDAHPLGEMIGFPIASEFTGHQLPEGAQLPEKPAAPAAAKVADSFEWGDDNHGAVNVGSLPAGTHVQAYGGTVFKVLPTSGDGSVTLSVVGDENPGDSFSGQPAPTPGAVISVSPEWAPKKIEKRQREETPSFTEGAKTTIEAVPPGGYFKTFTGHVFQVVSKDGPTTKLKNITGGTGKTFDHADGTTPVTVMHPAASGESLVEKHGLVPNEYGEVVGNLSDGAMFTDDDGAVHAVGSDFSGALTTSIVAHPTEPGLAGTTSYVNPDYVPSHLSADDWDADEETNPAPAPLPLNGAGQPIGSLAIGDHIQTDGGSVFQVIAKPPSGIVGVKAVHLEPDDPVKGTDDFGPTYVPAGVQVGALPVSEFQPGDPVQPGSLKTGDQFAAGAGNVYKVTATHPNGTVDIQVVASESSPEMIGYKMQGHTYASTWTHVQPGDVAMAGAAAGTVDEPAPSELKPYSPKSQTGGGYFFGTLGGIADGTKFTDKSGSAFEKVGKVGGQHVFKDMAGTHFAGVGAEKVKLLSAGPQVVTSKPDAADALGDIDKVPQTSFPSFSSPYNEAGDFAATSLWYVQPGGMFQGLDGSTYEMLGHKGEWSVYRRVIDGNAYAPVKTKHAGVYVKTE